MKKLLRTTKPKVLKEGDFVYVNSFWQFPVVHPTLNEVSVVPKEDANFYVQSISNGEARLIPIIVVGPSKHTPD